MIKLTPSRDPIMSLWQSAVDEVSSVGERAESITGLVEEATNYSLLRIPLTCSEAALKIAAAKIDGNSSAAKLADSDLKKFGNCDPLYAQAVATFVEYYGLRQAGIPYITYQSLNDFVLDGVLSDTVKIGIIGDWGTGQEVAADTLRQLESHKPDVVIHLGDVYYAGTPFEVKNYFLKPWTKILGRTRSFSLSGNHDMYSGGSGYYGLLKEFGQPASYVCLRNTSWQLLLQDTGYNDHDPFNGGRVASYLQDSEVAWMKDKVTHAAGRKTVVMTHHPLFSAFSPIAGSSINEALRQQVSDILPEISFWAWGHEHDLVVYEPYLGLKASACLGCGAMPMPVNEEATKLVDEEVPMVTGVRLPAANGLYEHGYGLLELKGSEATVSYYSKSGLLHQHNL